MAKQEITYDCFEHANWIGISIPKAACTSLRCWFRSLAERRPYASYSQAPEIHYWFRANCSRLSQGEIAAKDFSFVVTRNPAARALSAFQNKIANPLNQLFHRPELTTLESWLRSLQAELESGVAPQRWNEHWRPQVSFAPADVSFVARLENFAADLAEICERLELAPPAWANPPHMQTPKRPISSAAAGLVREIYREDFQRFYPEEM